MQQSWFTSDWHFFGEGFLKNEKRSHFKTTEEMNETITSEIFSNVKPGDNLYFLGDIGWKFPEGWLEKFFIDLKKHKIHFFWINGNHDLKIKSPYVSSLVWRGDFKSIKIKGQKISLFHYPMHVWESSHYGAWSLYGHIHYKDSTWNRLIPIVGKTLNVNCELYDFKPISFDQLSFLMSEEPDNLDLISKEQVYGSL